MYPQSHLKAFQSNGSESGLDIKSSGKLLKVPLPRSLANQLSHNLGVELDIRTFKNSPGDSDVQPRSRITALEGNKVQTA